MAPFKHVYYKTECGPLGIDNDKKAKLGENFLNKKDTIVRASLLVDISTTENTSDVNHYIYFNDYNCTKVIWIGSSEGGIASKKKGMKTAIQLAHSIELSASDSSNTYNINYYKAFDKREFQDAFKITHLGNLQARYTAKILIEKR